MPCRVDDLTAPGPAMTAKARLRGLAESLSEPEAGLAVAALTARRDNDAAERRQVMQAALAQLEAVTADLPPVDAVAVARQSREALEGRPVDQGPLS